jgi:hypothetical protein
MKKSYKSEKEKDETERLDNQQGRPSLRYKETIQDDPETGDEGGWVLPVSGEKDW